MKLYTYKIRYYNRSMTSFAVVEADSAESARKLFEDCNIRNTGIAAIERVK